MGKLFGLLGLIIVIGVGAYWYTSHAPANQSALEGGQNAIDKAKEVKEMVENKGIVSSLKDAVASGVSMHCTYSLDDTGVMTESWIDGEKIRTKVTTNNITTHALIDGGTQYMWTSTNKQGMKMDKACLDKMMQKLPSTTMEKDAPTPQDIKETFDAAKNVSCSPSTDADFSLPTDITFTDQCAMMEDTMKLMEQYKDKMPAGTTIPNMP